MDSIQINKGNITYELQIIDGIFIIIAHSSDEENEWRADLKEENFKEYIDNDLLNWNQLTKTIEKIFDKTIEATFSEDVKLENLQIECEDKNLKEILGEIKIKIPKVLKKGYNDILLVLNQMVEIPKEGMTEKLEILIKNQEVMKNSLIFLFEKVRKLEIENSKLKKKENRDIIRMDPKKIVGNHLIVSEDGLSATKIATSHSTVCSSSPISSGIHVWSVKVDQNRSSWCGEYWIMLGVHTNPISAKNHPRGDQGVYGLSCHGNTNGWRCIAGKVDYSEHNRIIQPGDIITLTLDFEGRCLTYSHKIWSDKIQDLPNCPLYPYFDPYDLNFKLI